MERQIKLPGLRMAQILELLQSGKTYTAKQIAAYTTNRIWHSKTTIPFAKTIFLSIILHGKRKSSIIFKHGMAILAQNILRKKLRMCYRLII